MKKLLVLVMLALVGMNLQAVPPTPPPPQIDLGWPSPLDDGEEQELHKLLNTENLSEEERYRLNYLQKKVRLQSLTKEEHKLGISKTPYTILRFSLSKTPK